VTIQAGVFDLDGVINTVGDRAFGVVTEVVMIADDGLTAGDQSDYHLVLSTPPAGMPGLTNGALLQAGISLVLSLGDSFAISNGDPASATPVIERLKRNLPFDCFTIFSRSRVAGR